jgi:hypothetical protein
VTLMKFWSWVDTVGLGIVRRVVGPRQWGGQPPTPPVLSMSLVSSGWRVLSAGSESRMVSIIRITRTLYNVTA